MSYCLGCETVFQADPGDPGCPTCTFKVQRGEMNASLLALIINERAGWSCDGKDCTVQDHSVSIHSGKAECEMDIRFPVFVDDALEAQEAAARWLLHIAVGLLSGGLPGVAQAKAEAMVREAAAYFEDERQADKRKAS